MRIRLKVEHLRQVVEEAGLTTTGTDGDVCVLTAHEMEPDEIEVWIRFIVDGGKALICGGTGRLLTGLQLRRPSEVVAGSTEAAYPELPELGELELPTIGGAGFALYRVGESCVALGAPRGAGVVAYVGTEHPPAKLVKACLQWLADVRFDS